MPPALGPTGRLPLRHFDRPDPIGRTKFKAPFTNLDDWRILAKCPRCVWPPKTLASINRLAPHRFRPFPGEPWAVAGWQDTAPLVFRFVARAHFSLWRRVRLESRCGRLRCLAAASLRLPVIDGVPSSGAGAGSAPTAMSNTPPSDLIFSAKRARSMVSICS